MNRRKLTSCLAGLLCLAALLAAAVGGAQTVVNTTVYNPPGLADNVGFDFEVAAVRDTGLVYVGATGAYGSEVGVIDSSSDALVAVVEINTPGVFSFARVNQTTRIVYFRQQPAENVVPVDGRPSSPTFNQQLAPLSFPGHQVQSFALDETRSRLYVTHNNTAGPLQSRVSVLDADPSSPTFHQVLGVVLLPTNAVARGVAVNTLTNKIYVAAQGGPVAGGVYALDGATLSVAKVPGTNASFGVVVNENSNLVYASTILNRLTAVDGATDTLLAFINVPGLVAPATSDEKLALNSTTGRVYLQTQESTSPGKVVVVDGDRLSPNFNTVLAAIPVGRSPGAGDIVVDETHNRVVATGFFDLETTIIDGATNTVVAVIPSTQIPSDAALDPSTHRVFVANQLNFVQEIDVGGASLAATIVTAAEAGRGVVNPNNHLFYVGRTVAATDVRFFDRTGASATVAGLPHGSGRYEFAAVNRNTNRVYALNSGASLAGDMLSIPGYVSVIDGATNSVVANVVVGNQPFGLGVNEATNKVYVLNAAFGNPDFPGSITVIDGATNAAVSADTSAFNPATRFLGDLAVNEATNRIYFLFQSTGPMRAGVLDGATNVATLLPPSLAPASAVRVNKTLNRVYVLSEAAGVLHVLDGANDSEIATLSIGSPATGTFGSDLAVNEQTGRVFVSNATDDTLTVVDGTSNTVVATIPVGDRPIEVAVNELANRVYVGNGGDLTISFVDGAGLTVESTLAVPLRPASFAVDAAVSRLYVTSLDSDTLGGVVVVSDSDGTFDAQREAIAEALADAPPGVGGGMLSKVEGAQDALAGGNVNTARNKLEALRNQVEAQRGKVLTDEEADRILALVAAILDSLD